MNIQGRFVGNYTGTEEIDHRLNRPAPWVCPTPWCQSTNVVTNLHDQSKIMCTGCYHTFDNYEKARNAGILRKQNEQFLRIRLQESF